MIIVNLTYEQVIEMAKLAILASRPVGLGFLHYQSDLKKEDIEIKCSHVGVHIDYFQGRMVKFYADKLESTGEWFFPDVTNYEFQSWKSRYDSYRELAEEVMK